MKNQAYAIDYSAIAARISSPLSVNLENCDIFTCLAQYIRRRARLNERAASSFNALLGHLEDFQSVLRFQISDGAFTLYPRHIGDEVLTGLQRYLANKGLSSLYVNRLIQQLKLVLDWSGKNGARLDPSYTEVEKLPERPKKELVALTLDDVSMIYHFNLRDPSLTIYARDGRPMDAPVRDPKHPLSYRLKASQREKRIETLERVRDAFVLSCCLGQRFSDMKRISREDFQGDKFRILQQKTGSAAEVDIPTFSVDELMVRRILEKYGYTFPYQAHISAYDRNLHALFRTMGMEKDLRRTVRGEDGRLVSEVVSRFECIASHTARRTFVTTNLNKGLTGRDVRIATGHRSESAFSRYDKGHVDTSARI